MAAIVGLRLRTSNGPVWVMVREFYEVRTTLAETIDQLRAWQKEFRLARIWCDASQLNAMEPLVTAGLPALGNQVRSIEFGVRAMYGLLKTKRLRVDPQKCPNLITELRRYSWKLDRSGSPKGKLPEDRANHAVDCVRMILVGEGEVPPEQTIDPIPPEEQPTIYRGSDGLMHDNIKATIARRKHAEDDHPLGAWWDEIAESESEDDNEEIHAIARYLNMPLGRAFVEEGE